MLRSMGLLRRCFATKLYTKSHEWVELIPGKNIARVGISDHAQDQLGEIIHIEFPAVGKNIEAGEGVLVIESVKIAADVYSPITGQVTVTNLKVQDNPGLVNEEADKTWLFEIRYEKEPSGLMNEEEYAKEIN